MILKGFKDSIPVFFCYFPLGIIYGLLFVNQGLPGWYAPLFCLLIYAGAAQFLALSFCAIGGSLPLFALAALSLCFRNVFYAISMLDDYKKYPLLLRGYLAFGLVDATFAILSLHKERDISYVTTLTTLNHIYWIVGSILGVMLCHLLFLPNGLEFSLAAFFTASSVDYLLKNKTLTPLAIATVASCVALMISRQLFFVIAASVAIVITYLTPKMRPWRDVT